MHLIGTIDGWGISHPKRLAFHGPRSTLTYGELYELSNRLAQYFDRNVDPGKPIIVLGHKDREQIIAYLACAKSGHAFVPVDDRLPLDRLSHISHIADAGAIVDAQEIRALLRRHSVPRSMARVRGDSCFYVMFTSGSTGMPKGVMITIRNVEDFVEWMIHEHQFHFETFLNVAPFHFDLSVIELWCGLASGSTIFSLSRRELDDPNRLLNTLRQADATVWVSTPSFAQMVLSLSPEFGRDWIPRLKKFLFCGERLQPQTAERLLERFPESHVYNMYGPTEATCAISSIEITPSVLSKYPVSLPVGIVRPGTVVTIDEDRQIHIRGRQVGLGYLGEAGGFYSVSGIRAYRTGDRGELDPVSSLLFVEGRLDDQVKIRGHRIELGDVEANIMRLSFVNDVVAGVTPGGKLAVVVMPLVAGFDDGTLLKTRLAEYLPDYMIPSIVTFVDDFPKTTNGKIDRRCLFGGES